MTPTFEPRLPHPTSTASRARAIGPAETWHLPAWARAFVYLLFAFAANATVRTYTLDSKHHLDFDTYMAGAERLPFQKRVLPMLLVEQIRKIPIPESVTRGRKGIFGHPDRIAMFAIDVLAFAVAGATSVWLYRQIAPRGHFTMLVYPVFVWTTIWSYIIHTEQNFYYPYDMLSLAFWRSASAPSRQSASFPFWRWSPSAA